MKIRRHEDAARTAPLTLAKGFRTSVMAGISETDLVGGDWGKSLASVPVEVDVDDVGIMRARFERVERGDSLVELFLRPRERKANASRTEPCVWRGGLGDLADGCGAPGGCID
jgi:hypothetical protein